MSGCGKWLLAIKPLLSIQYEVCPFGDDGAFTVMMVFGMW
jgi:hypothetical protein